MTNFNDLFDTLVNSWEAIEKPGYPMLQKDDNKYSLVQMLYKGNYPSEIRVIAEGNNATEAVTNAIDHLVKECDASIERVRRHVFEYNETIEHYNNVRRSLFSVTHTGA